MHPVASRRDLNHVFRLGPTRVRGPGVFPFLPVPVLARFCLWVRRVLQSVSAVRNTDVVCVERKSLAFAEVQDALVRAAPIVAEVRLVLIVLDQPPTPGEVT